MSEYLLTVPGAQSLAGFRPTGYPSPTKEITLTLTLRSKPLTTATTATYAATLTDLPPRRRYPTHEELADTIGGYAEDQAVVSAYFQYFNIQVRATSRLLGTVTLAGSITDFERALHTQVAAFQDGSRGTFLAATAPYQLPAPVREVVQHVQPLQPPVRKESRLPVQPLPPQAPAPDADAAASAEPAPPAPGYSLPDLARAYGFPAGATGEGQVIGFVELGGQLDQADLRQFFASLGKEVPHITEVGTPPASTGTTEYINNAEVSLDLQVAGALAPQARLVVYYGTTLLEALQAVVSDEVNRPAVVSVSWAAPEFSYSAAEVAQLNILLYQASVLGITIVAASADHGAYDGYATPSVWLPAANPLVLGCGGTTAAIADGVLTGEVVWNELGSRYASGGGYSQLYIQPTYQNQAVASYPYQRAATRGVPDVAALASIVDGYRVVIAGQVQSAGGTSGATPFVAALLALLNEKLGYRLGHLNEVLYSLAGTSAFRPITQGNNQLYAAAPYWNPCTGLGSPVGEQLLALLTALAPPASLPAAPRPDDSEVTGATEVTSD